MDAHLPDDLRLEQERIVSMLRNLSLYLELGGGGSHVHGDDSHKEREDLLCDFISLHQVIPTLPLEERKVIALVGLHGLNQTQAAERLGIWESTVRKRLLTAASRIQKRWSGQTGNGRRRSRGTSPD